MKGFLNTFYTGRKSSSIASNIVGVALLFAFGASAQAASLDGRIVDKDDAGLGKVRVCLFEQSAPTVCAKNSITDRFGYYSFNGVKPGAYAVGIDQDRTTVGRRTEEFKTFVWYPARQSVSISGNKEARELRTIVGKFNFSNYQRSLELRTSDFPELSGFDPYAEPVFIKVYHASVVAGEAPETVFLGRVGNLNKLRIEASIPLATTELRYDLYGASASASGVISLAN